MEEGDHCRPASILASVYRWHTHRSGSPIEVSGEIKSSVRDRLLGILFSRSFDIIDRGIGTKADLNFGCQVALGFRKSPLNLMRDLGEDEVKRVMDRFQSERPGFPMPQQALGTQIRQNGAQQRSRTAHRGSSSGQRSSYKFQ
jgi:enoyl-CoA hydratase/3-hydroxyacyl-CoA dehydrogenase